MFHHKSTPKHAKKQPSSKEQVVLIDEMGELSSSRKKPKKSGKRIALIVAMSVLSVILIVVAGAGLYVNGMLNRIHFSEPDDNKATTDFNKINWKDVGFTTADYPDAGPAASGAESWKVELYDNVNNDKSIYHESGVINTLLLGVDSRDPKAGSRDNSDTMMILSINNRTKHIILSSLMRDTAVAIPGKKNINRLNAAHSIGGDELTVQTIEANFKIHIDHYVRVSFYAFMDIVDAMGGLRLDVTEAERKVMNETYIKYINRSLGLKDTDGYLKKAGTDLLLTGKQALGFARNRYTTNEHGHDDFGRTQRQRIVIQKIIDKAKTSNLPTLLNLVEAMVGHITTDYSKSEIISLVSNVVTFKNYAVTEFRVPTDDTYKGVKLGGASVLNVDVKANTQLLRDAIYGTQNTTGTTSSTQS